jgi:site-specific recombinase XerD
MTEKVPINKQLALIGDFGGSRPAEGTRRAYRRVVREFFQFIGECQPSDVTPSQIIAWRDSLSGHNQPSTVYYKLIIIWTFFEYLLAAGIVDENPAAKKHVPRPPLPEFMAGRALTPEEVRRLLSGPDRSTPMGARDYALLMVMLNMALRVSEACSLRPSLIREERDHLVVRVRIKGGRLHKAPIPGDVWAAIQQYLTLDSSRRQGSTNNDPYIFQAIRPHPVTSTSKPLSTRAAYKIVAKWGKRTGIGDVSPHDLRRTAITQALRQGMSYRQIQMMTGHRNINTIQLYDHSRHALEEGAANFLRYEPETEAVSTAESKSLFARWKKRQLKRPEANGDAGGIVRYAILVRSVRVDGKPRQQIVNYLGSIRESKISRVGYRVSFWMKVERTLKRQKIEDSVYRKVLSTLSKVVPLPTEEEISSLISDFQKRSAHNL